MEETFLTEEEERTLKKRYRIMLLALAPLCALVVIVYFLFMPSLADRSLNEAIGSGDLAAAQDAVEHGADVNYKWPEDVTPLMLAAESSNHITALLIENGADVHARDSQGRTALTYAQDAGKELCVELLLAAGAQASGP